MLNIMTSYNDVLNEIASSWDLWPLACCFDAEFGDILTTQRGASWYRHDDVTDAIPFWTLLWIAQNVSLDIVRYYNNSPQSVDTMAVYERVII